jgi:Nucleotidyltransferase domain
MLYSNVYEQLEKPLIIGPNALCVLSTLIYFDVFQYPLTSIEIFERCTLNNVEDTTIALQELQQLKIVYCINGFYTLHNNEQLVERRLTANAFATKSLQKAKLISKLIKRFPYVRAIMLSGSIAKNYMDEQSDIDYFIVTAPNRLWVCRLFFVLVQKILFFNKYKYFCYNYMVDENHVTITDKSFYTAIEASTVLPVYNLHLYNQFMEKNRWIQDYFPNYPATSSVLLNNRRSTLQKVVEPLFNNKFGEWLDVFLMKKIEAKWRKAYSKKMFEGTNNLQLNRYTAKAHTEGHYNRIMTLYDSKKAAYETKYNLKFDEQKKFTTTTKINA